MKIIITGTGGQGVKYLAEKTANYLIEKGFFISLILSYDAAIEGGDIYAQLIYSKEKIENPLIDKADILVEFSKVWKDFDAKKKITLEEIEKQFPDGRINDGAWEILNGLL